MDRTELVQKYYEQLNAHEGLIPSTHYNIQTVKNESDSVVVTGIYINYQTGTTELFQHVLPVKH